MRLLLAALSLLYLLSPVAAEAAKELRVRSSALPQNLDWADAGSQLTSRVVFGNIMDGLTRLDADLKPQPALASSIAVSSDGKVYRFQLRSGVKWSDGVPLTAQHFVDAWKRLLSPLDLKAYAVALANVVGAEEYHRGALKDFSKVGIHAVSDSVLEVTLKSPQPQLTQLLAMPNLFPVRQDLINKFGRSWRDADKLVVLGPFVLSKFEHGKSAVLKRNPSYWGPLPRLDSVNIVVISSDAEARDAFKAGALDVSIPINASDARSFAGKPELHVMPQFRTRFLAFNTDIYPVSLPSVRQAIAMAIDRSKLAYITKHGYVPTSTLIHRRLCPSCADIGLPFNIQEAQKLLESVGGAPSLAPLDLITLSTDVNALATAEIAEQLSKNLGLKVTPKLLSYDSFLVQTSARGGPIFYILAGAEYPDADSYLSSFVSDTDLNTMSWKNARYDELVRQESALPDGPARTQVMREALDLLLIKNIAIVPLHFESIGYLASARVKGFEITPVGSIDLRGVDLTPTP